MRSEPAKALLPHARLWARPEQGLRSLVLDSAQILFLKLLPPWSPLSPWRVRNGWPLPCVERPLSMPRPKSA